MVKTRRVAESGMFIGSLVISSAKKGLLSVIQAILQPAIYFGSSGAKKDETSTRKLRIRWSSFDITLYSWFNRMQLKYNSSAFSQGVHM